MGIPPTLNLFHWLFIVGSSSGRSQSMGFVAFSAHSRLKVLEDIKGFNKHWKPKFFFVSTSPTLPFEVSWGGYFYKHKVPIDTSELAGHLRAFLYD